MPSPMVGHIGTKPWNALQTAVFRKIANPCSNNTGGMTPFHDKALQTRAFARKNLRFKFWLAACLTRVRGIGLDGRLTVSS